MGVATCYRVHEHVVASQIIFYHGADIWFTNKEVDIIFLVKRPGSSHDKTKRFQKTLKTAQK